MKFKATKEQLFEIASNAVNASRGGAYWPSDTTSKIQVTDKTPMHDSGFGKVLDNWGLNLDYVVGRMVKLRIKRAGEDTWEMQSEPRGDYQSWVQKCPTNEALVKSVAGVEILSD